MIWSPLPILAAEGDYPAPLPRPIPRACLGEEAVSKRTRITRTEIAEPSLYPWILDWHMSNSSNGAIDFGMILAVDTLREPAFGVIY